MTADEDLLGTLCGHLCPLRLALRFVLPDLDAEAHCGAFQAADVHLDEHGHTPDVQPVVGEVGAGDGDGLHRLVHRAGPDGRISAGN